MDLFYKPPLQRPDECQSLEDNYMNCMLQKALKDRTFANRCNLESILWFHLECPNHVAQFDDKVEFKRKWREFFGQLKAAKEFLNADAEEDARMEAKYGHVSYPDDHRKPYKSVELTDEFYRAQAAVDAGEDAPDPKSWEHYDPEAQEIFTGRPSYEYIKPFAGTVVTEADSQKFGSGMH